MISVPKTQLEGIKLWREDRKVSELLRGPEPEHLINLVANEIMVFVSLISAPTNINKDNVYLVSEKFMQIENVKHLSLRELKGFLKSAFELKYGKIYGGFGLDTLITWFNDFYKERDREFMEFSFNEHNRITAQEKSLRDKPPSFGNDPSQISDYI